MQTDNYPRTLSEQIRDTYFDAITDVVYASAYLGTLKFRAISELSDEVAASGGVGLHLVQPLPSTLAAVLLQLAASGPSACVTLYFPEQIGGSNGGGACH